MQAMALEEAVVLVMVVEGARVVAAAMELEETMELLAMEVVVAVEKVGG